MTRPSDDALWASVESTLRDVVLPALTDEFARISTAQLIGLAQYARGRGVDPGERRATALAAAIDAMPENPIVAAHWPSNDPASAIAAMLVDAVARADEAADEIRARLRPIIVAHLDEDLAITSVLGAPFRGRLNDG